MYFSRLRLVGFRNYESLMVELSPGINCFTGNNGEGKTNILEAVQYLCMTRGWQSKQEKYTLRDGDPYFSAEGTVEGVDPCFEVQCSYLPSKGKKILLDKRPLERMSDHIGRLPIVTVLPNDTQLIHGSPSHRRRFMDSLISQYSPEYLGALIRYENALDQRNTLLGMMAERRYWDPEQLDMWDEQLMLNGMVIAAGRKDFVSVFEPVFRMYYNRIVSEKELPSLVLDSQVLENTDSGWKSMLLDSRTADRYSQRSTSGIHKDDLEFSIAGHSARNFGSQGQQKTFIIALKFAQHAVLSSKSGKEPVLLLDDIFDKLDDTRLSAIASILENEIKGQVFVTDTSLSRMQQAFAPLRNRHVSHFVVQSGRVSQVLQSS